ncbi:hypothetical protein D3C71_2250660 [compost metagenome]
MDTCDSQAIAQAIALPQLNGQVLAIGAGYDTAIRQERLFDQMAQLKGGNSNQ